MIISSLVAMMELLLEPEAAFGQQKYRRVFLGVAPGLAGPMIHSPAGNPAGL
jgi:hypothetical protein